METKKNVRRDYLKMLPNVITNLIVAYPIFSLTEEYIKDKNILIENPIVYFFSWIIATDLMFYTMHYIFHYPWLYKNFHSVHHQFRYTYGMGAIYGHPLDFIITNLFPTFYFIYLIPPDDYIINILIIFSTSYTVLISHSCFNFVNKSHLIHHLKYKRYYGLVLSDKIFNTN